MRRGRRIVPTTPEGRIQQRLSAVEGDPAGWRAGGSSDNGPLRMIRGTFASAAPTIILGGGYTLTRTGAGAGQVNFSTAFPSAPSAVFTADSGGGQSCFCRCTGVSTTVATYQIIDVNGAAQESNVHFIVMGPA